MRRRLAVAMLLATGAVAGLIGIVVSLGAGPSPTPRSSEPGARADAFDVDFVHSTLNFKLRHFGVSNFHGRVNAPKGTFLIDDDDLGGSFIHVTAEVRNMDAGSDGRNRFLMSPDFFNVREYATTEFKSTSIEKVDDIYRATGIFSMHGVEREITADIREYTELQTTKFGYRAGFEAEFAIKRSDYGMTLFIEEGTLGDEVTIVAAIESQGR